MQHKFQSITQKPKIVEPDIFHTGRVIALSISHFIHDVYSSFLSPLLPLLIEKLSLSLTQAGFLSTIMQIPALLNPYIGKLADRMSNGTRYDSRADEPAGNGPQLRHIVTPFVHHRCQRVDFSRTGTGYDFPPIR
jgi:hypothetical protein